MYKLEYSKKIDKKIKKLPINAIKEMNRMLDVILVAPLAHGKGLVGKLSGTRAYRFGDYRMVCVVDTCRKVLFIENIGHRSSVYRMK